MNRCHLIALGLAFPAGYALVTWALELWEYWL